ncbi:single-strand binding protein [Alkalidesulfovibrio alkalitolerans DSM 16529]|uniref:Single-stranded DNA-binding protein n=1 Tax=Alkalidesulfovibrio alkalitolerans DSM 16529 TaxID=1121439 RepID=S7U9Q9_9BACT|nr:single-stranded DNA-binding protein [Alkalidesulfovibrio alkalitolerans]EPR30664.1 single-strand binding protein [Alkalidesulfovibrio alkalitolerans DSM 16529]
MAGSLNKVMIIGRMGSDAKLSYLPSGQPVTNFNVATDESYRDKQSGEKIERTEWHRIAIFGKSAEFCANYLGKGRLVYIEGALRTRKWQDKDGQDRYTTEIVVQPFGGTVQGLDSPRGQGEQGYEGAPRQQARGQGGGQQGRQNRDDDLGPAFPSEASGMDDVPF